MSPWVWGIVFLVTLAIEGWTIWGDDKPNTTLSAVVIWLRSHGVARGLMVASFSWLMYHWLFESDYLAKEFTDDWTIVVVGYLATNVRREKRLGMR